MATGGSRAAGNGPTRAVDAVDAGGVVEEAALADLSAGPGTGRTRIPPAFDARAAALAGLAAGVVYLEAMELDLAFFRRNTDDLTLLGRPFVKHRSRARLAGLALHLGNSVAMALAYALLAEPRLSGKPWQRGVLFASLENAALYPLTALEDRHPAVRDGQIDRYWNAEAFAQSVPRHAAYGAVLGLLYDRWRRKRGDAGIAA